MRLPYPMLFVAALTLTAPIVALADCSNPATAKASVDQIIALNNDMMQHVRSKGLEVEKIMRQRHDAGDLPLDYMRRFDAAVRAHKAKGADQEWEKHGSTMEALYQTFDRGNAPPDYQKACEALPQLKTLAVKYKEGYDRWHQVMLEIARTLK